MVQRQRLRVPWSTEGPGRKRLMHADELILFALDASRAYGEAVAHALGLALSAHE